MIRRVKIGVSRCLLGEPVRYDGKSKPCALVIDKLSKLFEIVPVCPEVEAGLPVPRPPVQLSDNIDQPRLAGRDNPDIDITKLMNDFCNKKIPELNALSGFILKSRSPSCGLLSTPVFIENKCVTETSSGIFAHALKTTYPLMPLIEETQLEDPSLLNNFIQSTYKYKF